MMKLGGSRCIEHKSRPSSNLGVIGPEVCTPQKRGVGLRLWENQRRLSSLKYAHFKGTDTDMYATY